MWPKSSLVLDTHDRSVRARLHPTRTTHFNSLTIVRHTNFFALKKKLAADAESWWK